TTTTSVPLDTCRDECRRSPRVEAYRPPGRHNRAAQTRFRAIETRFCFRSVRALNVRRHTESPENADRIRIAPGDTDSPSHTIPGGSGSGACPRCNLRVPDCA